MFLIINAAHKSRKISSRPGIYNKRLLVCNVRGGDIHTWYTIQRDKDQWVETDNIFDAVRQIAFSKRRWPRQTDKYNIQRYTRTVGIDMSAAVASVTRPTDRPDTYNLVKTG